MIKWMKRWREREVEDKREGNRKIGGRRERNSSYKKGGRTDGMGG